MSSVEEDIIIYKLPGEKLGLGLRFEGGSRANECVRHLYVQCTAESSPAAKTKCTWPGGLRAGDEILLISGKNVKKLTRLDCVRALKGMNMKPLGTWTLCLLYYVVYDSPMPLVGYLIETFQILP